MAFAMAVLGTVAYAGFLVYLCTSYGGILSWRRDRVAVHLAAKAAGAFGIVVLMWWAMVLLPMIDAPPPQ